MRNISAASPDRGSVGGSKKSAVVSRQTRGFALTTACCLLLTAFMLPAQEDAEFTPAPKRPGVRITFLPPPLDGTLSLGIFTKGGRLVRTLHREARTKEFTVGLNGLVTWWDGKDDAGAVAPSGKYFARGFAVGAVEFQGEAFHCNDWIAEDTLRFSRITDLRADAGGWRFIGAKGGGFVGFAVDANGHAGDFRAGAKAAHFPHPMNDAAAAKWQAIRESAESLAERPVTALDGEDTILATADGKPMLRENGEWRWLDLPELGTPIHACLGREGTLWVIDRDGAGVEVRQYSFAGEFQRRLAISPGDPVPVRIAASRDADAVAVIEESSGIQRVRMLVLDTREPAPADGAGSSMWRVVLSKTIRVSETFAAVRESLKSSEGATFTLEEKINVRLLPNQLVRNASTSVDIVAAVDAKGSFLRTFDGLELKRITETPGLRWAAMGREPGGRAVTIFQSDGAVVEEFKARKLASMMAFDAGDYEWTGK